MALILKFEQGGIYTYYGKKYNINELKEKVYGTLDNFISSIKYGNRNRSEITAAVRDLMNGLESGRVTVDDNRLYDSMGEYHNADKHKHDVYGMATAHILDCMNYNLSPIEEEKEKKKQPYTASVAGEWLNNKIFGTSKPNSSLILQFVDIDSPDGSIRPNTIRTSNILSLALDYLTNFDKYTENFDMSDEDRNMHKKYIELVIEDARSDNSFTKNEYLNLTRAFGNNNWDQYFTTDWSAPKAKRMVGDVEVPDDYIEVSTKGGSFYVNPNYWEDKNLPEIFNVFILGLYGNDTVKDIDIDLLSSDIDDTTEKGTQIFLEDHYEDIIKDLKTFFSNGEEGMPCLDAIVLTLLEAKYNNDNNKGSDAFKLALTYIFRCLSKLDNAEEFNNISLLPYLTNSNLIMAYDFNNNRLYWTSERKSKAWQEEAFKEFQNAVQGSNRNIISNFKLGGILKFDVGGKVLKGLNDLDTPEPFDYEKFINNFEDLTDEDLSKIILDIEWDYNNRLRNVFENGEVKQELRGDNYATNKKVPGNNDYDPEPGGKETENQPFYQLWHRILTSNEDIAREFAKRYALLETGGDNDTRHFKSWFNSLNDMSDENFNQINWNEYNWDDLDSEFNFEKFRESASKLGKDEKNGIFHDFIKGKLYFTTDKDGIRTYYKKPLNGYTASETAADKPRSVLFDEYELIKNADPEVAEGESDNSGAGESDDSGSYIDRFQLPLMQKNYNWYDQLFPESLAIGRLAGTLHNNNKVRNILRKSLKPVIESTYEKLSPVTGAFSVMQAYNQQAADINRTANRNATVDASVNLAAMLDANRQANQYRTQGFLTDDLQIQKTALAALERLEDNMARRSLVANTNRESINDTNRERAQLEASHQTQNWATWDNYLGGIEKRMRTKQQEKEDFYKDYSTKLAYNSAQNAAYNALFGYLLRINQWERENPNKDVTAQDWYQSYLRLNNEVSNWLYNVGLQAAGNAYGIKTSKFDDLNTILIRNKFTIPLNENTPTSSRRGGKLIKRKFKR